MCVPLVLGARLPLRRRTVSRAPLFGCFYVFFIVSLFLFLFLGDFLCAPSERNFSHSVALLWSLLLRFYPLAVQMFGECATQFDCRLVKLSVFVACVKQIIHEQTSIYHLLIKMKNTLSFERRSRGSFFMHKRFVRSTAAVRSAQKESVHSNEWR